MKSFRQYIESHHHHMVDEGIFELFKDTRKTIDISGWKVKIHHGKHPDVPDVNKDATILFAIDPKTKEEHHIASGKLSKQDIAKFMRMYGLKK